LLALIIAGPFINPSWFYSHLMNSTRDATLTAQQQRLVHKSVSVGDKVCLEMAHRARKTAEPYRQSGTLFSLSSFRFRNQFLLSKFHHHLNANAPKRSAPEQRQALIKEEAICFWRISKRVHGDQ
jgi:hypothetical protein